MSATLWDIFVVVTLILPGAVVYVLDDVLGTAIYAGFYKLVHKEGLPVGAKYGLICGKPTSRRLWQAILVAFLTYKLFAYLYVSIFITKVFICLLSFIGALVGFWLGPLVSRIYKKKDKALEVLDRLERGEIDLPAKAREATTAAVRGFSDVTSGAAERAGGALADAWEEAKKHLPGKGMEETDESKDESASPAATAETATPDVPQETEAEKADQARRELHDLLHR